MATSAKTTIRKNSSNQTRQGILQGLTLALAELMPMWSAKGNAGAHTQHCERYQDRSPALRLVDQQLRLDKLLNTRDGFEALAKSTRYGAFSASPLFDHDFQEVESTGWGWVTCIFNRSLKTWVYHLARYKGRVVGNEDFTQQSKIPSSTHSMDPALETSDFVFFKIRSCQHGRDTLK